MRFWKTAGALLMLTCAAAAQTLAPEVLLLARIKSRMREAVAQLPNYTCLETISRFHNDPDTVRSKLRPFDTVRLEIVYSDRREWYGSPGEGRLGEDNPWGLIGSGMMGTGAFALTINNILASDALITSRGEETLDGRKTVRYDYRLSSTLRGLTISIPGGKGAVGEAGSFWVDPQSLDLIRVSYRAVEIPPFLPLKEAATTVNYGRVRIGDSDVILAQQAEMHMLQANGFESYDRFDFTHCRAFSVQSAVRFDEEPAQTGPSAPARAPDKPIESVPALLQVTVQLTSTITDRDTVGTLIEGAVSGDVLRRGKIVIPDGSVVHGRIRRLERRYREGSDFIVGIEFTDVEVSGQPLRFYADLLRMDKNPAIRPALAESVIVRTSRGQYAPGTANITLPELPGVASFFVSGTTFRLPPGLHTVWRTRGLIR